MIRSGGIITGNSENRRSIRTRRTFILQSHAYCDYHWKFCLANPANVLTLVSGFLSLRLETDASDEGRSCHSSGSAVNGLVCDITRRTANVIYESFASAFKFWPHKERVADCRDSYDGKSTGRRSSANAKEDVQGGTVHFVFQCSVRKLE